MGTKGISKKVFETIFSTASVDYKGNSGLEMLMRYYKDDIPKSPRFLYDSDAVYFFNFDEKIKKLNNDWQKRDLAERGDIMTSIWTPLTYYLKLNKDGKIIAKNNASINIILPKGEAGNNEKFTLFNYLAEHYASRGNLLLLPNMTNKAGKRNLNPDKFMMSEDKLDQFLYYCFKGNLMEYFNDEKNLVEWIYSENLECMFSQDFFQHSLSEIENGEVKLEQKNLKIKVENLQALLDNAEISEYKYRNFSPKDWETYFDRLNKVIAYRNSVDIKPHLPLKWDKRDHSTTTEKG